MANAEYLLLYSIGATENEGGIPSHRQCAGMHSLLLYCRVCWCYMVQYKHSSVHTLAAQTHIGDHTCSYSRPDACSYSRTDSCSHSCSDTILSHSCPDAISHCKSYGCNHSKSDACSYSRPDACSYSRHNACSQSGWSSPRLT